MRATGLSVVLTAGVLLICAMTAHAETSEEAFAAGDTLLAKGDLPEALQAYSRAIRADRSNQQYAQKFLLVRRALLLQESLKDETDSNRWSQMAQALRSFYVSQGLHAQALPVDEQIHVRINTSSSAAQLAETQLALNKDSDAAKLLSSLKPNETTSATQSLFAIALTRQGKVDEAREIADRIVPADDADCDTLYNAARVHAAVGNSGLAMVLLTRCFEAVPPSRLDAVKSHTRKVPEFASLASSADFAQVMQTQSKVQESQCSSGSSCSSCPRRSGCPKSRGQ